MFRVLFKILLTLGALFAAATAIQYFVRQQGEYVEIFGRGDRDEECC